MEHKHGHDTGHPHGALPQAGVNVGMMQGHWLLARMGKRVLRPGGLELTRQLLQALDIDATDRVVEFAPGLGVTARMTLQKNPASYIAIEKEETAVARVAAFLPKGRASCRLGLAEETGLPAQSATVVYGEAMLTMHPDRVKLRIMREAARILIEGGRYGIHEIGIVPDNVDDALQQEIRTALSRSIHVGTSPATIGHWSALLAEAGFAIEHVLTTPFHLLEPQRILQDEGFFGGLRFAANLLRHREARRTIFAMRRAFHQYRHNLRAVALVAVKRQG